MSLTRVMQAGAELNTIDELVEYAVSGFGSTQATASTTKVYTGTYSFRFFSQNWPRGVVRDLTQFRANAAFNHNGTDVAGTIRPLIYSIPSDIGNIEIFWNRAAAELWLTVDEVMVDSIDIAGSGISTTNVWYNVGLTAKAHASAGFVTLYVDGVAKLTWTGNTGTVFYGVFIGGISPSGTVAGGWAQYAYFDDFYVDEAVGEPDEAPSNLRFLFALPSAAGSTTELTPNTGANYAAVDEATPDGDTTFVYGTAVDLQDNYDHAAITIPTDYTIRAVIPTVLVRKTDASAQTYVKLGTRTSGGTEEKLAAAQTNLTTSYQPRFTRFTQNPNDVDWTETLVNEAEIIVETAGVF